MPHLLSAWWQETSLSLASPAVEPERTVGSRLAWGTARVPMKSQRSAGEQALPVLRMSMPVSPYSAGEQPAVAVVRCSRCRRAGVAIVVARKPRRRRSYGAPFESKFDSLESIESIDSIEVRWRLSGCEEHCHVWRIWENSIASFVVQVSFYVGVVCSSCVV